MELFLELEFEEGKRLGLGIFFCDMVMGEGVMSSLGDGRGVMSVLGYFGGDILVECSSCLLYTSPSPRDS